MAKRGMVKVHMGKCCSIARGLYCLILKLCVQPSTVVQVYNPSTKLRLEDCLGLKANLS